MKKRSARMLLLVLLLGPTQWVRSQSFYDDSSLRQDAAQRITTEHGLAFDWRKSTLSQLTDAELRLDTVKRIQQDHGLHFDWQKSSLTSLTDTELRLDAVKRIKQEHGVQFDWQKSSLSGLTDAELRMDAAKRLSSATGKAVDWRKYPLADLTKAELRLSASPAASALSTLPAPGVRESSVGGIAVGRQLNVTRTPSRGFISTASSDSRDEVKSDTEDMSWEIRKLRRNADQYDADEYTRKLKRLQTDAEDLSSRASDAGADDTSTKLDDAAWELRKARRDVETDKGYYYREREDDLNRRLKRVEWNTDDAGSALDE